MIYDISFRVGKQQQISYDLDMSSIFLTFWNENLTARFSNGQWVYFSVATNCQKSKKFTFYKPSVGYVLHRMLAINMDMQIWLGKVVKNDFLFWFSVICKTAENYFRLYERRPRSATSSDNALPYYLFLFYVKLTLPMYHSHSYLSLSIWKRQQQHITAKLLFSPPL